MPDSHAGERFGRLVAKRYLTGSKWLCQCDCGKESKVATCSLVNGHIRSCGCLRRDVSQLNRKHGHTINKSPTTTWRSWCDMKRRCTNPKRDDYYLYGGRGITFCQEWEAFEVFLRDMGERPPGTSLGRIDNEANYCPSNCRWETSIQQANNKRNNHSVTVNGETKNVSEWARKMGADPDVIFARIGRGWPEEEAVTRPLRRWDVK